MEAEALSTPRAWEAFYVIVGSTAGALTGLQFVVLTLVGEAGIVRGTNATLSAFASPNVVHFCTALLVSAAFSAPWHGLVGPGVCAAIVGVCGFIYSVAVIRRASRQRDYQPVLEDWIWHAALPMLAYAALFVAGLQLTSGRASALFVVGAAVLLLVFIGIHNAWDTVMYVLVERSREQQARTNAARSAEPQPPPAHAPAAASAPTSASGTVSDGNP